jgi:hypothetical protein
VQTPTAVSRWAVAASSCTRAVLLRAVLNRQHWKSAQGLVSGGSQMRIQDMACGIVGMMVAVAIVPASRASVLTQTDTAPIIGAACPNVGCVDKTCVTQDTGCPRGWTGFCEVSNGKCRKLAPNNFARCGDANSKAGFTCSETTNGGCAALMTGDTNAGGTCPEGQCVKSASCGSTAYVCTSTACGS